MTSPTHSRSRTVATLIDLFSQPDACKWLDRGKLGAFETIAGRP